MRNQLLHKLNAASRKAKAPRLEWPQRLPADHWWMSPELISLHGTEVYAGLREKDRKRLSFFEAVNFFSLNVHGEKSLVAGLGEQAVHQSSPELREYLHHFLEEESQHMAVFGEFCQRYAGRVYPDRKLTLPREFAAGEEEFLFFAKVLLFEEIVDAYNERMGQDERLHPLAVAINRYHHRDELRHLAFGRQYVRERFEQVSPGWDATVLARVRRDLADFFTLAWREYWNPEIYRDAGLTLAAGDVVRLRQSAAARQHRWSLSERCRELLQDLGVDREELAA